MFDNLTLAEILKKQYGILRNATNTRPVIWRIEENGVKAIVKDFSLNSYWFRNIAGRFLIWREKKAYKRIEGIPGVPALYGCIDGKAIVIEEIQGTDIGSKDVIKSLDDNFFKALQNLITRIHDRGIAHCDLKRAPNIMIGNDGNPYIIDWAASVSKSELGFFPLNIIYKRFVQDDLNAITKIKLKWLPDSVSPEEKQLYYYRSMPEKIIRTIRDWLRVLLKKFA